MRDAAEAKRTDRAQRDSSSPAGAAQDERGSGAGRSAACGGGAAAHGWGADGSRAMHGTDREGEDERELRILQACRSALTALDPGY